MSTRQRKQRALLSPHPLLLLTQSLPSLCWGPIQDSGHPEETRGVYLEHHQLSLGEDKIS